MYARIVVPLDGSELAEQALKHARELAKALTVPLHLIRVVDVTRLERLGAYGLALEYAALNQVGEEEESAARTYFAQITPGLIEDGLTVTTAIVRGLVVPVLIESTTANDLIVIASHGRSGLSRWFLGSVAEEVVRKASAPVLIVRATAG